MEIGRVFELLYEKCNVNRLSIQVITKTKTKLRGLSPHANYTDRAAAAGRRSQCQLLADRGVSRGQRNGSPQPVISVFQTWSRYFFHSSSSSIDLTRLSGPRSRPTTNQKNWQRRGSNPGPLYLQPETLTTRPQRRSIQVINPPLIIIIIIITK